MNKNIIKIIIFATGVIAGSVGTYYYAKNKYEVIIEQEIALLKERFDKQDVEKNDINSPGQNKDDEAEDSTSYPFTVDGEPPTAFKGYHEHAATREPNAPEFKKVLVLNRDKYQKIAKRYMENEERARHIYDPAEEERPTEDIEETYEKYEKITEEANNVYDKALPYIISVDQFADEKDHYDKITINYYEEDDTLCEENEEIIEDPMMVVGEDTLTRFGEDSDDPDVVYVRNEKLEIDYEVICLHKSYAETVGISVEDAPIHTKIRRRGGHIEK